MEREAGFVFDAIKPCSTRSELYLLVSSSWRHSTTSGNVKSSVGEVEEKDERRATDYKLVLFDMVKNRVRRKVCHMSIPLPAKLFYSHSDGKGPKQEFIICATRRKLVGWSVLNKCGPRAVCPEECGIITALCLNSKADLVVTGHERLETKQHCKYTCLRNYEKYINF